MPVPTALRYTPDHEWINTDERPCPVGITDYAANALGDVVFVQLPEAGERVTAGSACGEIESTKSVSDLVAPVSGTVTEVNSAVVDDPALLNSDPYGAWLFRIDRDGDDGELLSAAEYDQLTAS